MRTEKKIKPRRLVVDYDPENDILTVEGVPYHGEMFRKESRRKGRDHV